MTPNRSRKEVIRYRHYLKELGEECVFCEIGKGDKNFVGETKSFKLLRNKFPYTHWDDQKVTDHLMITPKKHIDSLSVLDAEEAVEYMELLGSYESHGYNVYSRAPQSGMKTITHQHTHLIKTHGKPAKFVLHMRKPYLRIIR